MKDKGFLPIFTKSYQKIQLESKMEHNFLGGSSGKFLEEMEHVKGSPVFSVGMFHMEFCVPVL